MDVYDLAGARLGSANFSPRCFEPTIAVRSNTKTFCGWLTRLARLTETLSLRHAISTASRAALAATVRTR